MHCQPQTATSATGNRKNLHCRPQTEKCKLTSLKLTLGGFPLYINWWGFVDFQKQQHILTNIDTKTVLAAKTNTLHGAASEQVAYVPLGEDFINGRSPYENQVNYADQDRWYPMIQYQEQAINTLLSTGPGVAKFNGKKTVEAKCHYTFILSSRKPSSNG